MAKATNSRACVRSLFILVALVAACFMVTPAHASSVSPGELPAPTNLKVTALTGDASQVQVSWDQPSALMLPWQITEYVLELDDQPVANFKVFGSQLATSYAISSDLIKSGGALTVTAMGAFGQTGPASEAVHLSAASIPTVTQMAMEPDEGNEGESANNEYGGAINQPTFADRNQPTPFEVYGANNGILMLADDNQDGWKDIPLRFLNLMIGLFWSLAVLIQLVSTTLLAWALIGNPYEGMIDAVTNVISGLHSSEVFTTLMAGASTATLLLGAFLLAFRSSEAMRKCLGLSMVMLIVVLTFYANFTSVVPTIINGPTTLTKMTMVEINKWEVPGTQGPDYSLSIQPTYDGDPMEQGIRRYLNESWLNTVYPAYCQINFGDMKWATTTVVPDNEDLPEYKGLTFCEFLLKAQTEKNTVALDALKSKDGNDEGVVSTIVTSGVVGLVQDELAGHQTGYIEAASPDAWQFYQANDASVIVKRLAYNTGALGSSGLDSALKSAMAVFIMATTLALAMDMILVAIVLIFSQYPPVIDSLMKFLRAMWKKTWFPAALMALFMIVDKIMAIIFSANGPRGWLVELALKGGFTVILISYGVLKLWRLKGKSEPSSPVFGSSTPRPQAPESERSQSADGAPAPQFTYSAAQYHPPTAAPKVLPAKPPALHGEVMPRPPQRALPAPPRALPPAPVRTS